MLTDLRKTKFQRLFNVYDFDRDNAIEKEDFEKSAEVHLKHSGHDAKTPEGQAMRENIVSLWTTLSKVTDINDDGRITLDEFLQGMDRLTTEQPEVLKSMARDGATSFIRTLDKDRDGKVSREEFAASFNADTHVAKSEGEKLFQRLDADGSGFLTNEDVERGWIEFLFSDDPNAPGNGLMGPLS